MDPYLLGLRLRGRRVLVVGGGAVGDPPDPGPARRWRADILLVSPAVTASLEDLAAAGRIRWEPPALRRRRLGRAPGWSAPAPRRRR